MLLTGETVLAEVENAPNKSSALRELRFAERAIDEVVEVATTLYRGLDELRDAGGLGAQVRRAALQERFDELMIRVRSMGVGGLPSPRLEAAEWAIAQLLVESAPDVTVLIREFIRLSAGMGRDRGGEVIALVAHPSVVLDLNVFEHLLAPRRGRLQVIVPPPTLSALARHAQSSNPRLADRARRARLRLQQLRELQSKRDGSEDGVAYRIVLGGVNDLIDGAPKDLDTLFVQEVRNRARANPYAAVLAATSGDAAVLAQLRGPDIFAAVFTEAESLAAVAGS